MSHENFSFFKAAAGIPFPSSPWYRRWRWRWRWDTLELRNPSWPEAVVSFVALLLKMTCGITSSLCFQLLVKQVAWGKPMFMEY